MSIAAEAYAMALRAVERMSARVLLTAGRRFDASSLGPVAANVHVEPWIDQARVLEQAELVVCHGGSGTTLAEMAATPTVEEVLTRIVIAMEPNSSR